ncbi:unnamed protein product, partial [marine sediment metagenome]
VEDRLQAGFKVVMIQSLESAKVLFFSVEYLNNRDTDNTLLQKGINAGQSCSNSAIRFPHLLAEK